MTDGIGVDIVEICRFKKIKYNLKPSFYKKLFKQNEIDYCLKFKNPYEHFAGKFALKESVFISEYVSRNWSSVIFNKLISKLSIGAKGNILKS